MRLSRERRGEVLVEDKLSGIEFDRGLFSFFLTPERFPTPPRPVED
jgi:hypothetical protein